MEVEDNNWKLRLDAICLKQGLESAAVEFNLKTGDNAENRQTAKFLWTMASRIFPSVHGVLGISVIRFLRMLSYLIPEYRDITQKYSGATIDIYFRLYRHSAQTFENVFLLLQSYNLAKRIERYANKVGVEWKGKIQLHSWVLMDIIQKSNSKSKSLEKESLKDCLNSLRFVHFEFGEQYVRIWTRILDAHDDLLTSHGSQQFLTYCRQTVEALTSQELNDWFLSTLLSNLKLIERGLEKFREIYGELHDKTMTLHIFRFCLIIQDPIYDFDIKHELWKNELYPELKKCIKNLEALAKSDYVRFDEGKVLSSAMMQRGICDRGILISLSLLNSKFLGLELKLKGSRGGYGNGDKNLRLLLNLIETREKVKDITEKFKLIYYIITVIVLEMVIGTYSVQFSYSLVRFPRVKLKIKTR